MTNRDYQAELRQAIDHLGTHDPRLAAVIVNSPPCTIEPHTNYYAALVSSIIGQQLSVKAAAVIKQRFYDLFGGSPAPEPRAILEASTESLRAAGLSNAKVNYIRDLAVHVLNGRITFDRLANQSNEEIIAELTAVKGIGEWTAHMFLLFCVGRMDVLPTGDLGVRSAIQKLYGLESLPSPQEVKDIASNNHWHPYESIASWYLWRYLDNAPS